MRPGFAVLPPTTVSSWDTGTSPGSSGPVRRTRRLPRPATPPRPGALPAPGALPGAARSRGSRRRPLRSLGLAIVVGAPDRETWQLADRRAGRHAAPDHERRVEDHVEGRLELAAEGRPDVGDGAVRPERHRHADHRRERLLGQRAGHLRGAEGLVAEERAEARREEPVLVLGALRPRRDHVLELVVAGRRLVAGDVSLRGVDRGPRRVAARHVLADVVEVEVDRGRVAPGRPILGGGVERDLHLAPAQDLGPDQAPKRLVDFLDHPVHPRWPVTERGSRVRLDLGPRRRAFGCGHVDPPGQPR